MSHALPRVLLLFAAAFALVAANPAPGRLGMVTTLVGDATLTRGAAAPRPVAFKDEVKPGDTIRTTPGALVRVLVRGATLVAIGESSTVALAADAGRSNVRLESGTVSVVASGAKPAPLDIRTPHATASLRGTSVIAQTGRGGAATTFYVLTGAVEVKAGAGAGLTVRALESTTVRGGSVGPIVALSKESAASLMKNFRLVPAHPDAATETVKAIGERGASEAEKEARALREQGVKGLPRTDDPSRRPVVPIQPNISPTTGPKG